MSEVMVYERKRKTKEQCSSVPGTPKKPTPHRPEINRVYIRKSRMKLQEKAFDDESSETVSKIISHVEKDAFFDSCMALSDKEKEQSSDRTEKRSKLDLSTSLNSLIDDNPLVELPFLFQPKASQPYAMSKDDGVMRERVTYDQILVNNCSVLESKKHRQTPKRKIHRPKVAFDNKPKHRVVTTKKPRLATPKQAREKKPKKFVAAKQAKEDVGINEAKVARALDFRSESLDAQPEPVESDPFSFSIKKKRSKRRRRSERLDAQSEPVKSDPFSFLIKKRRSKRRCRLNWFSFPLLSVKGSVKNKKKKQFSIRWFSRKRRIPMKRRRKVTEALDAKTNATTDKMNLLRIVRNATDEMNLLRIVDKALDANAPIIIRSEIGVLETDKMDVSERGEIEVLRTDIPIIGKRKRKENTIKARGQGGPLSEKDIDSVVKKLRSLHISHNSLVTYRGSFHRRKKVVPNIILDLENVIVYNLLMGVDVDRIKNEANEETEKWWEKEREIYIRRTALFISILQPIQGDRNFRKWNGSVLDSVIGVFLTQNVSDTLSSNAFLSLASRFPAKSAASGCDPCLRIMPEYDAEGNHYFVTQPEPEKNKNETRMNTCLPVISNTNLPTSLKADLNGGIVGDLEETSNGCLQVISDTNLPTSSIPDLNGTCRSIVQLQDNKMPKDFRKKIPKLKERDYSIMGFGKRKSTSNKEEKEIDWESIRRKYSTGERISNQMDTVDWERVRLSEANEVAACIVKRGQSNVLAKSIQELLNRLVNLHNCLDLEWLLKTPPDLTKQYLLHINGLGLKSVECVRLLALEQVAFPVDVNVARIVVRLGWVPLQPLPEELQLHRLELYPILDKIQIYLWPRLCTLPHEILYNLHYHMITFGKVFCTKVNPNCNACPMRDHCKHYQSQSASGNKALPSNKMKSSPTSTSSPRASEASLSSKVTHLLDIESHPKIYEPIIEEPFEPPSPSVFEDPESCEPEFQEPEYDYDSEEIPIIKLNAQPFKEYGLVYGDGERSNALVALNSEAALKGTLILKKYRRLRTEHMVYELPRNHILLEGLEQTESDDDVQYHLATWIPGEIAEPKSSEPPNKRCNSTGSELCDDETCYTCNNNREIKADVVRGTLLIPSRVACRQKFPLNGTYFQVNEVFADHETSLEPLNVSRKLIYNLRRRTAYFGASIHAITRGESLENIRDCFLRGIICVRGINRSDGNPKCLTTRFHGKPVKKFSKEKVKKEPNGNIV